ncbi:hypothetical protein [Haloechinothrix aidingensis]|uniref:hypothetical protein n=1 Tax=Haloechinothrix aidingensis TaxID=2752311 RepID=UPI001FE5048C|nr:hypothetical protein [Haloechinothrix aidingensis]
MAYGAAWPGIGACWAGGAPWPGTGWFIVGFPGDLEEEVLQAELVLGDGVDPHARTERDVRHAVGRRAGEDLACRSGLDGHARVLERACQCVHVRAADNGLLGRDQFPQRSVGEDPALPDHEKAVGGLVHFGEHVAGQQHRSALGGMVA